MKKATTMLLSPDMSNVCANQLMTWNKSAMDVSENNNRKKVTIEQEEIEEETHYIMTKQRNTKTLAQSFHEF